MWKIIFSLLIIWLAGFFLYIHDMRTYDLSIPKADGIVVLTGALGRIDCGLNILKAGQAQRMLITGVRDDFRLTFYLKPEHIILKSRIDLGYQAFNTVGNAIEANAWVKNHEFKTIILVTSDYHKQRALLEFSYYLPSVKIFTVTTHTNEGFIYSGRMIIKLCREYNKLIGSMIRFLIYKIYDISLL